MLSVYTSTRPAPLNKDMIPATSHGVTLSLTQSPLQGVHKIIHKYMDNLRVITNMSGLRPLSSSFALLWLRKLLSTALQSVSSLAWLRPPGRDQRRV